MTPVGGNTATTLGQARLNVFERAAELWGAKLVSGTTIVVDASFAPFDSSECDAKSGTLGQAQTIYIYRDFSAAPQTHTFYSSAETNALAGSDLDLADDDIVAYFNGSVDTDPNCLGGAGFYYGLDNAGSDSQYDLLNVVMHELGHGLGFSSYVDPTTGAAPDSANPGYLGIFDHFVYDETQAKFWTQLSDAQRQTSATNNGNLTWNGAATNAKAGSLTAGVTNGHVRLYAPTDSSSGSSVSHWDTATTPDLLMEPYLTSSQKVTQGVDFTSCELRDIGWTLASGVNCPDDAAPTVSLSVTPASINVGATAELQWTSSGTSACTASGAWSGSEPLSGGLAVSPSAAGKYTYSLSCSGGGGSASATTTLQVNSTSGGSTSGGTSGGSSSGGSGGGGAFDLSVLLMLGGLARRSGFRRLRQLRIRSGRGGGA